MLENTLVLTDCAVNMDISPEMKVSTPGPVLITSPLESRMSSPVTAPTRLQQQYFRAVKNEHVLINVDARSEESGVPSIIDHFKEDKSQIIGDAQNALKFERDQNLRAGIMNKNMMSEVQNWKNECDKMRNEFVGQQKQTVMRLKNSCVLYHFVTHPPCLRWHLLLVKQLYQIILKHCR